jgi:glyoxalase family protein
MGIHHVTAIAGDAQRNLELYVGTLGLRLARLTVNFPHGALNPRLHGSTHWEDGDADRGVS